MKSFYVVSVPLEPSFEPFYKSKFFMINNDHNYCTTYLIAAVLQ